MKVHSFMGRVLFTLVFTLIVVCVQNLSAQDKPARTEKVVFGKGAVSTTKSGTVRGQNFNDYIFSAKAGQKVDLKITSKQNVNFTLLDKSTMLSFESDGMMPSQIDEWSGMLPKTGDYVVRVFIMPRAGSSKRVVSYALKISIGGQSGSMTSDAGIENTAYYICEPNAELRADYLKNGNVRIRYGTQDFTLDRVPSGSGAKYQKGKVMFWSQRNEATLDSPVLSGKCTQK